MDGFPTPLELRSPKFRPSILNIARQIEDYADVFGDICWEKIAKSMPSSFQGECATRNVQLGHALREIRIRSLAKECWQAVPVLACYCDSAFHQFPTSDGGGWDEPYFYAGIHFEFDNAAGKTLGRAIGESIVNQWLRPSGPQN